MSSPTLPLFTRSLRSWLSAKGVWLLATATIVPLVFAGAWAGTHRADVTVGEITYDAASLREGEVVHFEATVRNDGPVPVGAFNATLQVAIPRGENPATPIATNETAIEGLAPGESRTIALDWTASAGVFFAIALADSRDTVSEVEELDNRQATAFSVAYREAGENTAPNAPKDIAGPENGTVRADLAVIALEVGAGFADSPRTAIATIENLGPDNATDVEVVVRVGEHFNGQFIAPDTNTTRVDVPAGQTVNVTLTWSPSAGAYWAEAWVNSTNATDTNAANNHATQRLTANAFVPAGLRLPDVEEKATVKAYYTSVVADLYLPLIIPLVALFYAAGILADERDNRSLPYVFTRPTPRWHFPLVKFAAGFLVAAVSVIAGLAIAFVILFTTAPQASEVGYFTTPLIASLLALFAYGGVFTLLGVSVARPYLWGMLVVAWEYLVHQFVAFMQYITVNKYVEDVIGSYTLATSSIAPPTPEATRALLVALGIGVAFLALAVYQMKRRDLEV